MRLYRPLLWCAIGAVLALPSGHAAEPLKIREALALKRVDLPVISPTTQHVVYPVRWDTFDGETPTTKLYLTNLESRDARPLVPDSFNSTKQKNAIWLSDTVVGFTVDKDGKQELWACSVTSGSEPYLVTQLPVAVSRLYYTVASRQLLALVDLYPSTTVSETVQRDADESKRIDTAKVYTQLMIRHWDKYTTEKSPTVLKTHLVDVNGRFQLDGDFVNLLQPFPAGPLDFSAISVSPNGELIAFASKYPSRDVAWTTNVEMFLLRTAQPENPLSLTNHTLGAASSPEFSPDGQYLAWLQMHKPQYESDRNQIIMYRLETGERFAIAPQWDASPSSLRFTGDGSQLLAVTHMHARRRLFAINWQPFLSSNVTTATTESLIAPVSQDDAVHAVVPVGTTNTILATMSAFNHPTNLYRVNLNGTNSQPEQLTAFNAQALAQLDQPAVHEVWFDGANHDPIHGLLLKPHGYKPNQTYPLVVMIHGGPQGSWDNQWSTYWNPLIYTGAGYAVWMPNIHGSQGYGQALVDSVSQQWGGKPYQDILKSIDHLQRHYPWVDVSQMCAMGGSYGGYMTNWINSQTSMFKCLVNHAGLFSTLTQYYTTDELWFPEHEFNGVPWDSQARSEYSRWSPERFVEQWQTPVLITHGEEDYRVPQSEGISTFTALQRRGVPSKLVLFAKEGHGISKTGNLVVWVDEVLKWFNEYLGGPREMPSALSQ
ncbi:dipeptidylpeptidase [Dimargaris verticillata]|uniref:Dipeptidyl-peptidase V n=1 Tax=Dimargaris verticillata TaxID=2761393 RepID=A0A9W8B957_9FUNG|nr:dipeptidylpeptidase [Dimargaris verticillata]